MTRSWTGRKDQALYTASGAAASCRASTRASSLRSQGDPVLYLNNPAGVDAATRRRMLDALAQLNQKQSRRDRRSGNPDAHRAVRDGVPHADLACRN